MNDLEHQPIHTKLFFAQLVTTIVGTACYPLDTLRRRMMMQSDITTSSSNGHLNILHSKGKSISNQGNTAIYTGTWDCIKKIYRNEGGIRGFYPGLSVNIVRGLSGGLMLVGYDELKRLLD